MARKKTTTATPTNPTPNPRVDALCARWLSWRDGAAPPLGFDPIKEPRKSQMAGREMASEWFNLPINGRAEWWPLACFYLDQIARRVCSATATNTNHPLASLDKQARELVDLIAHLNTGALSDSGTHTRANAWGSTSKVEGRARAFAQSLGALKFDADKDTPTQPERVAALWLRLVSLTPAGEPPTNYLDELAREAGSYVDPHDVTRYLRGERFKEKATRTTLDNYTARLVRDVRAAPDADKGFSKSELHRWRRGGGRGVHTGKCATAGCKIQVWELGAPLCMECIAAGVTPPPAKKSA